LCASREVERQSLHAIQEFPALQLASFAHLTNPTPAGSLALRIGA
jgi:hypothetical protein